MPFRILVDHVKNIQLKPYATSKMELFKTKIITKNKINPRHVIIIVLLFWAFFFLLMLVFVLQ